MRNKIILIILIALILFVSGCSSSYNDCIYDCMTVKYDCKSGFGYRNCDIPRDEAELNCYEECRPK